MEKAPQVGSNVMRMKLDVELIKPQMVLTVLQGSTALLVQVDNLIRPSKAQYPNRLNGVKGVSGWDDMFMKLKR